MKGIFVVYRLRKYSICCLLLTFAFLCTCSIAADRRVAIPTVMRIKLYYTDKAVLNKNPSATLTIPITTETTFSDVQNYMRQHLKRPEGSLMNGSITLEACNATNLRISTCFQERNYSDKTFEEFEQYFSFYAFDFVFHSKN